MKTSGESKNGNTFGEHRKLSISSSADLTTKIWSYKSQLFVISMRITAITKGPGVLVLKWPVT